MPLTRIVPELEQLGTQNIASAATTDIGAGEGNFRIVSGNANINSLGAAAVLGEEITVVFTGTPTLVHSSTLVLPGSANIAVEISDVAKFRHEAAGSWRCTSYMRRYGQTMRMDRGIPGLDYNLALETGHYTGAGGAGGSNSPPGYGRYGGLLVLRSQATYITQLAGFGSGSASVPVRLYIRGSNDVGATWTPWREIFSQDSILGAVSQSAGVPTGAIIERGSNANGEYTKFADGTLICTYKWSDTNTAPTAFGNIWLGDAYTWTFPVSFVSPPFVTGMVDASGPRKWLTGAGSSVTNGQARFQIMYGISTGPAASQNSLLAIGRWF